jgi:thioesterase domain-containing protein
VYGVETFGINRHGRVLTSIEAMARTYLEAMQQVQQRGPYHIAGYSFGGILAFEMAQQLRRAGHEVGLLGLIDTVEWHYLRNVISSMRFADRLNFLYGDTIKYLLFGPNRSATLLKRLNASLDQYKLSLSRSLGHEPKQAAATIEHRNYYALTQYRPQPYHGQVHLFRCPDKSPQRGDDPLLGWGSLATHVAVREIPGEHDTVLSEPFVHTFSRELCVALTGTKGRRLMSREEPIAV